jgi:hypothetical protein
LYTMALRPLAPKGGSSTVPLISETKKRDLWTKELDNSLRQGVSEYGCNKRWGAISDKYLNGIRNRNQCRDRWNRLRRNDESAKDDPSLESAEILLSIRQEQVQEQAQEQVQETKNSEAAHVRLKRQYDELTLKNIELERQLKRLMSRIGAEKSTSTARKLRSHPRTDIRETIKNYANQIQGTPENSLTAGKRVVLEKSALEGWGVFAKDDFMKGDRILRYEGEIISRDAADKLEEMYKLTSTAMFFMAKADRKRIIDATNTKHISRFVNHSCAPNAGKRCHS